MDKLNVLIIGSGGREHAIAWKIHQSKRLNKLFIAPGNPGTATLGTNLPLTVTDRSAVIAAAQKHSIDLVVVTPDDPLAAGMVDDLQRAGIKAFGPTRKAAKIEWSKAFAKDLMKQEGIPTARFESFRTYAEAKKYLGTQPLPIVIKASGLALGKGVIIARTKADADKAIEDIMVKKIFGAAGDEVVIEEYLEGQEISIHAFCDGTTASLFPSSQDHKQIFDGDRGPNTGGMGTIAPVPWVTKKLMKEIELKIVQPTIQALKKQGHPFVGCLYPGLMITKDGPKVFEFNARFGDPETQSYMRLLKTDLLEIFLACVDGMLKNQKIKWISSSASCIVMASKGYPQSSEKGIRIEGISAAEKMDDMVIFHAATKNNADGLVTSGGRVLGVTAVGNTLYDSLKKGYNAVDTIQFSGMQYRRDIGRRPKTVFKSM